MQTVSHGHTPPRFLGHPRRSGNFVPLATRQPAGGTLFPLGGRFVPRGVSATPRGTLFPGPSPSLGSVAPLDYYLSP
jgi:hypothetical protein